MTYESYAPLAARPLKGPSTSFSNLRGARHRGSGLKGNTPPAHDGSLRSAPRMPSNGGGKQGTALQRQATGHCFSRWLRRNRCARALRLPLQRPCTVPSHRPLAALAALVCRKCGGVTDMLSSLLRSGRRPEQERGVRRIQADEPPVSQHRSQAAAAPPRPPPVNRRANLPAAPLADWCTCPWRLACTRLAG